MSYPLINGASINGASENITTLGIDLAGEGMHVARFVAYTGGDHALELGAARAKIGIDIALRPLSLELAWEDGGHFAISGVAPSLGVVRAGGDRAVEVGLGFITLQPIAVEAGGDYALELGGTALLSAAQAGGDYALEVGESSQLRRSVLAGGDNAVEVGAVILRSALLAAGINLGREDAHTAVTYEITVGVQAGGDYALEMGAPGTLKAVGMVRGEVALELGNAVVSGGSQC